MVLNVTQHGQRKEPTLGLLGGLFIVFSTVSGMVGIRV